MGIKKTKVYFIPNNCQPATVNQIKMNTKPVREGEELNEGNLKKFLLENNLITDAGSD